MNRIDRLELQESERRLRLESSEATRRIQLCSSFASTLEVVANRSARVERRKALTRAKSEHLLDVRDSSLKARALRRAEASQSFQDSQRSNSVSLLATSSIGRVGDGSDGAVRVGPGRGDAALLEPLPLVGPRKGSDDKKHELALREDALSRPGAAPSGAMSAVDWAVKHAEARSESVRDFLSRWKGTLGHHLASISPPPTAAAAARMPSSPGIESAMANPPTRGGGVAGGLLLYGGGDSSPVATDGPQDHHEQQPYFSYPRLRNITRQRKTAAAVAAGGHQIAGNGVRGGSVSPKPLRRLLLPSLSPKPASLASPKRSDSPLSHLQHRTVNQTHERPAKRKLPQLTELSPFFLSITPIDLVNAACLWIERNASDVADAERLASQVITDVRRDANLIAVRQREAAEQRARSEELEQVARRENERGVELARQRAAGTIRDITVQSKVKRNVPESQLRWERLPSCMRGAGGTIFSVADAEKALHSSVEASLRQKQEARRVELEKSVEGFAALAENSESALAEARQRAVAIFKASLTEYLSSRTPAPLTTSSRTATPPPLLLASPPAEVSDGLPPHITLNAVHRFDGSAPLLLTSTWLRSSSKLPHNGSNRSAAVEPNGLRGSRKATALRRAAAAAPLHANHSEEQQQQQHHHSHRAKSWIRIMLQQVQRSTLPAAALASIVLQYHRSHHFGEGGGGETTTTSGSQKTGALSGDNGTSSALSDTKNALVLRGPRSLTLGDIQLVMEYASEVGISHLIVGPDVRVDRIAAAALVELVLLTVPHRIPRLDLAPSVLCDPPEVEAEVRQLVRKLREVALHHRGVAIAREKLASLGQVEAAELLVVPTLRRRAGTSLLWIVDHFCRGERLARDFMRCVEADLRLAVGLLCAADRRRLDDLVSSRRILERWQTELSEEESRERVALENLADRNVVLITKEFVHLRQTVRRISRTLHLSGWFSSMRRTRQSFAASSSSNNVSAVRGDESGEGSLGRITNAARREDSAAAGGSSAGGGFPAHATVSPVSLSSDDDSTPLAAAARERDYDALAAAAAAESAAAVAAEDDGDGKSECNREYQTRARPPVAHDDEFGLVQASQRVITPPTPADKSRNLKPSSDGNNSFSLSTSPAPPPSAHHQHSSDGGIGGVDGSLPPTSSPPLPPPPRVGDDIPLVELPSGDLTEFARTSELMNTDVRPLHSSSAASRQKAAIPFQSPPPSRQRM